MSKKLAICVPHYKREEHLKKFVPHMDEFFKDKDIEYKIFVANQVYPDSVSGFNRGTAKNIAYDVAQKEGYDYFCFHDIDMVPVDDSCDYSWPGEYPQHLAVRVEQFNWGLQYEEYFGGAILMTKDHVKTMNGYSNGYFNWGMEDDDFLYRAKVKGLTKKDFLPEISIDSLKVLDFDGNSSYIKTRINDKLNKLTEKSFTFSTFVLPRERFDVDPYLIGDIENRRFQHSYIISRPTFQLGMGYDNSSCFSGGCYNFKNDHFYMWAKRQHELWTHVVYRVDVENKKSSLFINGEESSARFGSGIESPMNIEPPLKKYGGMPYYIGVNHPDRNPIYFDGQIGLLRMYDRALPDKEIKNMHTEEYFNNRGDAIFDLTLDDKSCDSNNVYTQTIDFPKVKMNELPYRRQGKYKSLYHKRNDIVNTKFVHQKDTSINEQRFINEVLTGLIDVDKDGITDLNYNIVKREYLYNTEHEIIDFRCEQDIPSHVEY